MEGGVMTHERIPQAAVLSPPQNPNLAPSMQVPFGSVPYHKQSDYMNVARDPLDINTNMMTGRTLAKPEPLHLKPLLRPLVQQQAQNVATYIEPFGKCKQSPGYLLQQQISEVQIQVPGIDQITPGGNDETMANQNLSEEGSNAASDHTHHNGEPGAGYDAASQRASLGDAKQTRHERSLTKTEA